MKAIYAQGSKNYFLLIDEFEEKFKIDKSKFTQWICNKFDVLDGVLFLVDSSLEDCSGKMIMFNPDGSEAEMCGNGIRIVARKLYEKINEKIIYIETKTGKIKIEKIDSNNCLKIFKANINPVKLDKKYIPINLEIEKNEFIEVKNPFFKYNINAIRVQNPHIVFIVDTLNIEEINRYGKWVAEHKNIFPEGINLNFVKILDKNKIFVITYERGAGITNSCGTGMSSSAYICAKLGYCNYDEKISVYNKGGKVECIVNKDSVDLIGNATFEKEIILNPFNSFNVNSVFSEEIDCYNNYLTEVKNSLPSYIAKLIYE